jgi:hypothetical protein
MKQINKMNVFFTIWEVVECILIIIQEIQIVIISIENSVVYTRKSFIDDWFL